MKAESLIRKGIKACIIIPLLGYFMIIVMIMNYMAHSGTIIPDGYGGFSEFSSFAPVVMFVSTVLNLISVFIGIVLTAFLVILKKRIEYHILIIQIIEIVLLLWIIYGKLNNIPILWILFD